MSFNRYSLDLESSSSQYAYIADNAALSITGDISVEAWIKLEQLPSTAGTNFAIAAKFGVAGQYSWEFCIDTTDKLFFWYNSDGSGATATYGTTGAIFTSADVGKWVHVAVNVDVSTHTIELYKMGVSQSVTYPSSAATSIYDGTADFSIGARTLATKDFFFDGLINNLRVWSDIRTGAEILANMYSTLTGTSNNLVGSWYSTANDHNDLAGTNNLTAVNTPVFSTNVPWTGANDTDWTSSQIQADYTKVSGSSNLTNYPALIKDGNIPDAVYGGLLSTGADLRITTDSAGTTEIPFEIVAIDTTAKTAEIWAKIPTLSYTANTSIYLWYGNANAVAYDANAPFGSQAVWSGYSFVTHLEGASTDKTSNANPTTDTAVTYNTTNGKITQGAGFNGSTSYVSITNAAILRPTTFNISFWVKYTTAAAYNGYFQSYNETGTGYQGVAIDGGTTGTKIRCFIGVNSYSGYGLLNQNTAINDGSWHKIDVAYNKTDIRIYLDGSLDCTPLAYTSNPVYNATNYVRIADLKNGVGADIKLNGNEDEVRLYPSALSADWIATEYANQNSPSTFWSAEVIGEATPSYTTTTSSIITPSTSRAEVRSSTPSPITLNSSVITPTTSRAEITSVTTTQTTITSSIITPSVSRVEISSVTVSPVTIASSAITPSVSRVEVSSVTPSPVTITLSDVTPATSRAEVLSVSPTPVDVTSSIIPASISYAEIHTATPPPATITLSVITPATSFVEVHTASPAPLTPTSSIITPTATRIELSTVTTSQVTLTSSVITPTTSSVEVRTATPSPATITSSVITPSTSYIEISIATPSPITLTSSVVTPSITRAEIASTTTSPITINSSAITPSASRVELATASPSPLTITSSTVAPTSSGAEVRTATPSPLTLTTSVKNVITTYVTSGESEYFTLIGYEHKNIIIDTSPGITGYFTFTVYNKGIIMVEA